MKSRHKITNIFVTGIVWVAAMGVRADTLRPPAVPLVACDPYFSIWSPADRLTDTDTVHWTGKPHRLRSAVTIDGRTWRVMGREPAELPALNQDGLQVLPTRTVYDFSGGGVALRLTFITPALPEDVDLLSRPVTYVTYEARSTDAGTHDVSIRFRASGELAVNQGTQEVAVERERFGKLETIKIGSTAQPVLKKSGDDIRIDWGYLYLATPHGTVSGDMGTGQGAQRWGQVEVDLGTVGAEPVARWLLLAYDDLYSIQYFMKNLRPYWRRNGWEAADLLKASAAEFDALQTRCAAFDRELMDDLRRSGGANYANLAALAYRQCFAAGKFVADENGQPLQFCKENHSNGCIGTADVFYPMSPQFLLFGPTLAKSFLVPFMNYAASEHWPWPFAPPP